MLKRIGNAKAKQLSTTAGTRTEASVMKDDFKATKDVTVPSLLLLPFFNKSAATPECYYDSHKSGETLTCGCLSFSPSPH
jgi:hypothetical protein